LVHSPVPVLKPLDLFSVHDGDEVDDRDLEVYPLIGDRGNLTQAEYYSPRPCRNNIESLVGNKGDDNQNKKIFQESERERTFFFRSGNAPFLPVKLLFLSFSPAEHIKNLLEKISHISPPLS